MKFILEAVGDFPEFDKQMKWFMPVVWNDIKGGVNMVLPLTTSRIKKEEDMLRKYIKNLDMEVRLHSGSIRTAYTYPAMRTTTQAALSSLKIIGALYFIHKSGKLMRDEKIFDKAISKNGIAIFPKEAQKFKILVFVTKGLLTTLDEKERVAVILHEIGHWARVERLKDSAAEGIAGGLGVSIPFLAPFAFILLVLSIADRRAAEYEADRFAKKLGYGIELKSALDKLSIVVRKKVSFLIKMTDVIQRIFVKIHNFVDKFLPTTLYPSIKKRKAALSDWILIEDDIKKSLNQSKNKVRPLFRIIDGILSKILKYIFPIK